MGLPPRARLALALLTALALTLSSCTGLIGAHGHPRVMGAAHAGIHKIRHVIVIMQENRSFDSYFGTFPGADGIPMQNGRPTACLPDPALGRCVRPYHESRDTAVGGPHQASDALADINGGRMNGFVRRAVGATERARCTQTGLRTLEPACVNGLRVDVMGDHDAREIPNYWSYARGFVLQDHMFEPNLGWSLPSHLFMVSGWSASCASTSDPVSCTSNLVHPDRSLGRSSVDYAWTDLTYLLHRNGVSWAYYLDQGFQPDCG